jgi:hypothetical protein
LEICLARPREVQSSEREVLEWWPPVRVREREKEEDNGRGFKYPRTRAQPDIVWADRTLSGLAGLCLAMTLCPQRDSRLVTWKNLNFADYNATKHLYIVYNIYIIKTCSSSKQYINMTMFSAT